jgi:hypothetical protein
MGGSDENNALTIPPCLGSVNWNQFQSRKVMPVTSNTSVWRKSSVSPFLLDFEMYTLPQLGQTTEQLLRNTHLISVPLKAGNLTIL